jgi:hypothetical protein
MVLRSYEVKTVAELSEADVGDFFELPSSLLPEAFKAFFSDASESGESVTDRGGCKGLMVRGPSLFKQVD